MRRNSSAMEAVAGGLQIFVRKGYTMRAAPDRTFTHVRGLLFVGLLCATMPGSLHAQMDPYFTAINYPVENHSLMVMGDDERFGFHWNSQQHYVGPVFTYDFSFRWSVRLEPAVGLSNVSDPFMLRMGVAYMFGTHH